MYNFLLILLYKYTTMLFKTSQNQQKIRHHILVVKELNEKTRNKNAKRVAILYFDNTSGEVKLNKLKKGLAGMLITRI